jgi:hypothetical protein
MDSFDCIMLFDRLKDKGFHVKTSSSQVHVALPFTSILHVPLFSHGLLAHGETENKKLKSIINILIQELVFT